MPIAPGPRHEDIFTGQWRTAAVKGNLILDSGLPALVIGSGDERITASRKYRSLLGLKWRRRLDD